MFAWVNLKLLWGDGSDEAPGFSTNTLFVLGDASKLAVVKVFVPCGKFENTVSLNVVW